MQKFKIEGMMCPHCRTAVGNAIARIPGVKTVEIDLDTQTAEVEGDVLPLDVMTAVTALGYGITLA